MGNGPERETLVIPRARGASGVPPRIAQWLRPRLLRWRSVWRSRLTFLGAVTTLLMVLVAMFAPQLAPYPYQEVHLPDRLSPPTLAYLLGTDQFGRDVLSRIIYGAQVSLAVGVTSTLIALVLGVILGCIAAFYGGWTDEAIMRAMDVVMAFPSLILAIALIAVTGPSMTNLVLVIGLLRVPEFSRVTRGSALAIKEKEFVEAGRALGLRDARLITRHILPNILAPILVLATLAVSTAISAEAALSFLGLGVQPPVPSWGQMLADGRQYMLGAPWLATFPGLAISVTILGINLFGDGLRDALDPRLHH
ncbi:MAG: ABC transporter permease [Deinococcus sp.]|nr:ABC transporter permease [Deinococcus sp.]